MIEQSLDPLAYYAEPGPFTSLSTEDDYAPLLEGLPDTIPALVQAVQGNMIHIFWAQGYGVTLTDEQRTESAAPPKSCRIHAANPRRSPHPPTRARLVGNCRDFGLLCAPRGHGIPASLRLWNLLHPRPLRGSLGLRILAPRRGPLVMVDAQIDALQRDTLKPDFDPLDVPRDRFITGGHAWQMVRTGEADPDTFGIFDMKGTWFIVGNLIRDVAALNKMELLPWDCWGAMVGPDEPIPPISERLFDRAAAVSWGDNDTFAALRALYDAEEGLRVPPVILDVGNGPPREVTLADEAGVAL